MKFERMQIYCVWKGGGIVFLMESHRVSDKVEDDDQMRRDTAFR